MLIDSSALVAIMTNEDDSRALSTIIKSDPVRLTTPSVVWEVVVNIARKRDLLVFAAKKELEVFLEALQIKIIPIPPEAGFVAVDAYDRYGKGRHPAQLNFGDCLSYATAKILSQPLLFKGDDFSKTDLVSPA